jgi:hypothetical protein
MYGAPAQISWIWIVSSLTGIKLTSAPIAGYLRAGPRSALTTERDRAPCPHAVRIAEYAPFGRGRARPGQARPRQPAPPRLPARD